MAVRLLALLVLFLQGSYASVLLSGRSINSPLVRDESWEKWRRSEDIQLFVLHAHSRLAPEIRALVSKRVGPDGVLGYLPENSLLLRTSWKTASGLRGELKGIAWVDTLLADDKVHADARHADLFRTPLLVVHACPNPSCLARLLLDWDVHAEAFVGLQLSTDKGLSPKEIIIASDGPAPAATVAAICRWFSRRSEVLWVQQAPSGLQWSLRTAVPLTLGTLGSPAAYGAELPVTGRGEIIGLADSGLDTDLCFFFDPSRPIPYDSLDILHRKVIYYDTLQGDRQDAVAGHGTSIASIIAGSCPGSSALGNWSGLAPDSQLAFVDLYAGNNGTGGPPYPQLLQPIWDRTYSSGARIHLDSWIGYNFNGAAPSTTEIDRFAYEHPDFLMVRPAGNFGPSFSSLAPESCSKNSLVVGASLSTADATVEAAIYINVAAVLAPELAYLCSANVSFCNLTITNTTACEGPWHKLVCPADIEADVISKPLYYSPESLAGYSSKGPTRDGRLKPDMCAVGQPVVSARAHGPSTGVLWSDTSLAGNLVSSGGTSVAAAVVAGAAALVRQYLRDGYYPTGFPTPSDSIPVPPASLLKAILLNFAEKLTGQSDADGVIYNITDFGPSDYFYPNTSIASGQGRLDLRSLPFAARPANSSFVISEMETRAITQGQVHAYCFSSASSGALAVSLVWTDYPALPLAALQLVTDLDLRVLVSAHGAQLLGNGVNDTRNNVEVVRTGVLPPGDIRVEVRASNVPVDQQLYSLVVRGPSGLTPAPTCIECTAGSALSCTVSNGHGITYCSDAGTWGACLPTACDNGYQYSEWTHGCIPFASNLLLFGAALLVTVLTAILVVAALVWYYRRHRGDFADRRPEDVGVWEIVAIVQYQPVALTASMVCAVIAGASLVLQPLFVGRIFSSLQNKEGFSALLSPLFAILGIILAELAFAFAGEVISLVAVAKVLRALRDEALRCTLQRPYHELVKLDKGELQTRLLTDTTTVVGFPTSSLQGLVSNSLNCVLSCVIAIIISWQLSLTAIAISLVLFGMGFLGGVLGRAWQGASLDSIARMGALALDVLENFRAVKLGRREAEEIARFATASELFYKSQVPLIFIKILLGPHFRAVFVRVVVFAFLVHGSSLVLSKGITVNLIVVFLLYVGLIGSAIGELAAASAQYKLCLAAAQRLQAIMNLHEKSQAEPEPESSIAAPTSSVRLRGIRLQSPSGLVLKDLSMTIERNALGMIVGPSGAGKSSVLLVLSGLLPPDEGEMYWDATDVYHPKNSAPEKFLARRVLLLEQQPKLFFRTLRENLLYSAPRASDAEVASLLDALNLTEYVRGLPKGLDSVVGVDTQPSGGEAQRIALARTLLTPGPELLLLDEPTSEMDEKNALAALRVIALEAKKRTVLIVTHELRFLQQADRVYFMRKGAVAEAGTLPKLLDKSGAFARFCNATMQAAGASEEAAERPSRAMLERLRLSQRVVKPRYTLREVDPPSK